MQENNIKILQSLEDKNRRRNAFAISLGTVVLLGIGLIATFFFNTSPTLNFISLSSLSIGVFLAAASIWLNFRGRHELGIGLILFGLFFITISHIFVTRGLSIPIGIINFVIVSSIVFYSMHPKWTSRIVLISFIVASATIIADQYTVDIPVSKNPQIAISLSILLGGLYLIAVALQFNNFTLRSKLIVGFLILTTFPLFVLGLQSNLSTRNILEKEIKADILDSSISISNEFQTLVNSQNIANRDYSRLPEIIDYLTNPDSQNRQNALDKLNTLKKNSTTQLLSYALLDKTGKNILDTNSANIGSSLAEQGFFKNVLKNNQPFVSGMILTSDSEFRIIYFSTSILSNSGDLLGVFVATYNAKYIQNFMDTINRVRRASIGVAQDEYTYLIDGTNFFTFAQSTRVDLNYKTFLNGDDPRLAALQSQGLISPNGINSLVIPQPEIVAELSKMNNSATFRAPSQVNNGNLAEASAIRIPNSDWILVTARPVSTISTIIEVQNRTTVITSIIITILAALLAVVVSNIFTTPLIQLTRVAENITAGDFTQRALINSKDEIGILANTFNTMSSEILELITGLEQRVEDRTTDLKHRSMELEQITKQSEKRADELQTIGEIARHISTEKELENLLPLIAQTVSERFGYYHIGIFLLNENRNFAILRATNSPGGKIMLARQHKLEVGQVGIVGNVTFTGTPRIALDTGADAIYFNNPDLPETRSEMALPLIARGKIIGALDVQSTIPNGFNDSDVSILSLLADQIAIAIDNVRLLDETQNALKESQSLYSEYLADSWQKKSTSEILGYHQTLIGGQLITGNSTRENGIPNDGENESLAIPIRLRNQVIGTLNIRANIESRIWTTEEVNIVEAIAERLGLALDNARLFEETSSRAVRERLVSDITTKIRGTNDPQEMIKTAVEELKRALGATRVELVSKINTLPPDK